jgi:hypothetical protein
MVEYRKKRRRDQTSYSHPIGTPESQLEREIERQLKSEETPIAGHPHPGEALENQASQPIGSTVNSQPPVVTPIVIVGGGQVPAVPGIQPQSPRPAPAAPAPMGGLPNRLDGSFQEAEAQLYENQNVAKVKQGGLRKKHIDVTTADGEKERYEKFTDAGGNVHWNKKFKKPKESDEDEDEDEDEEPEGEGLWS